MMVDPRGVRFAATLSSLVLVLVLVTGSGWLALAQAVGFAAAAGWPRRHPYSLLFRWLVAPRLGPPTDWEPAAPARFAQLVGLAITAPAAVALLAGWWVAGLVLAAMALTAAFLNAAFGLCVGCELYLAMRRLVGRPLAARLPAGQ